MNKQMFESSARWLTAASVTTALLSTSVAAGDTQLSLELFSPVGD